MKGTNSIHIITYVPTDYSLHPLCCNTLSIPISLLSHIKNIYWPLEPSGNQLLTRYAGAGTWRLPQKQFVNLSWFTIVKNSNYDRGVKRHRLRLRGNATAVFNANHDVEARYQIAKALVALEFPEIAAGEAQKTIMLIETGLNLNSALGETVRSMLKIPSNSSTEVHIRKIPSVEIANNSNSMI